MTSRARPIPEGHDRATPYLCVRDAASAIEFYRKAFGATELMRLTQPDGKIGHAEIKIGAAPIMLGSGKHGPGPDNPWDTVKQGVYVYVEDVDAHYARAKAAGAEIVMELKDTDYGSRGYSVRDLEGHLWSFGTYRPGT